MNSPDEPRLVDVEDAAKAMCPYCRGIEGVETKARLMPEYLRPNTLWHALEEGWGHGANLCESSPIWLLNRFTEKLESR